MMRGALTALILLLPAAVLASPQHITEQWSDLRPKARGEQLLRSAMMAGHNEARRQYGVGPLTWDEGLASDAGAYAEVLARSNRFEHDPQRGRQPKQGEN